MIEWLAAAAPILGGLMGMQGQRDTNETNKEIAGQTSAFNAAEAQRNRDFQAEMSNTAHQREVEDLKKAGLSPLLAMKGGASTPTGSSAQGESARMENPLAGMSTMFNSAIQAYKTAGEIKMQEAQADNIKAQTDKYRTDTESTKKEFPKQDLFNDFWKTVRPMVQPAKRFIETTAKKVQSTKPSLSKERMKLDRKKLFNGITQTQGNDRIP